MTYFPSLPLLATNPGDATGYSTAIAGGSRNINGIIAITRHISILRTCSDCSADFIQVAQLSQRDRAAGGLALAKI